MRESEKLQKIRPNSKTIRENSEEYERDPENPNEFYPIESEKIWQKRRESEKILYNLKESKTIRKKPRNLENPKNSNNRRNIRNSKSVNSNRKNAKSAKNPKNRKYSREPKRIRANSMESERVRKQWKKAKILENLKEY